MRLCFAISSVLMALPLGAADPKPAGASPDQIEFFEKKVRPLLVEKCYSCHGPKKQSAGLRLDSAAGVKTGADDGPVIVPGQPAKSRLIASVKREGEHAMPPKESLSAEAVAVLTEWVKHGAPYPADVAKNAVDPRRHWAFQPIANPPAPRIPDAKSRIQNEIDSFIVAKLSDKGMSLAPPADKRTLIRRAYFDLIGLPPTADEIDAFAKDTSPQAFEKIIDKLLASPQYGERWGRYWLDVARYADTKGYVFTEERAFPFAYTYRDYVIRSFNEDKPFDRFIVEQLAADKLALGADKRPLAAMGYLTLGRRFLNNVPDIIDDRIDVVSRGLMGLTMSCARCHDHKFDPIPIKDYYSLYGVFASSVEPKELPLIGEVQRTPEVEAFEKELAKREAAYTADAARRHAANLAKLRSADGIADYLRAVLDAKAKPESEIGAFIRDRGLSRFAFEKWRTFFTAQTKSHSPIYSPFVELRAIPGLEFDVKAPVAIAALGKDSKKPVHPQILKGLTDAKPKSFRVAVEAIAKVLVEAPRDDAALRAVFEKGGPLDISIEDAAKIQNRLDRDQLAALRKKIDAFKAASPAAPPRAHVLNDTPQPVSPVVFLRGNPNSRGPGVPRQFPEILAGADRKPFTEGSGRLELARAIASPNNPLTARVFVNRAWIGHFGQGLVRTPSDFGIRSDPPTHPELLDWLASRFMHEGWSLKKLHKLVMLSATYQQSSIPQSTPANPNSLDPENRWLSHQNRRRLDFEALRDSLLVA
ncbi:MAG TPA: PSD1 and planctomycete cytochrome C domain-containing protein, partial [Urbifossiella sp.]